MRWDSAAGRVVAGLVSLVLLGGCAVGATSSPSATPTPTATPTAAASSTPVPATVAVSGRQTCAFLGMTTTVEGEFTVTHDEHYRCTDQMSDPRVSGTSDFVISTRKRDPLASYDGTAVLSNDGGTWRGTGMGAISYRDGQPTNYTTAEYQGEGGYAGLRYTVLGTGSDEGLVQAGWIEPTSGGAPVVAPGATSRATQFPEKVVTYGEETCTIAEASYEGTIDREKFHCVEAASDPRVNGEWEAWFVTTETGGGLGWWTGDLVITNEGGTWRGKASGITTGIPVRPTNYGEVVWVGEGGYVGLTYHELVNGSNGHLNVAGWIEPTKQSRPPGAAPPE